MKASYIKESDGYLLRLDELSVKIPFKLCLGEYISVNINEHIMDMIVYKYDNECLQWTYNGEVVTKDTVEQIVKSNGTFSLADFNLTVKE